MRVVQLTLKSKKYGHVWKVMARFEDGHVEHHTMDSWNSVLSWMSKQTFVVEYYELMEEV